ncbi:MAG: isochorismatase family cysteine hydrolase [Coriobacteriia bacterium]|nr:isochorismatase family cysteine hydrolase [Coriobacteriia bacterium]
MAKPAIIVIDMLNDFVTGPIASSRVHHIIPQIKALCERAREAGVPVLYANDCHTPEIDKEFKVWGPHAVEGTPGAQVIDELTPQDGDFVIPKKTYSAFYQTTMDLVLRELGVDTVIITGWQADCCCRHTSADAFFRGYDIVVPRETTDTTTEEGYVGGLEYMKAIYGAQICSVDELEF